MRCERLIKGCVFLALLTACSREAPAPAEKDVAATETAAPAPAPSPSAPASPTYDQAITWFRTTPGFHFVITESGTRAEGDMSRPNVGAERVAMKIDGAEWSAESGAKGVAWKRAGKDAAPPEMGNRLYQRVTVAFDPEKREGQAQLVEPGHFRFTDANSGAVHDVWVNAAGQIEKMTVGNAVSLTLSAQK
jgi:hypothetical protein